MTTRRSAGLGLVVDALATLVLFAVLGVAGAFVWHAVVDLPTFTRTGQGGQMDGVQLTGIVGIDGWFFAIGGLAGLVAGAGLMLWRHEEPLLLVVLLVLGGGLAAWLMLHIGLHLGPGKPGPALHAAHVGAQVPVQLKPKAHGVEYAWPLGALVGALVVLLVVTPRSRDAAVEPEHAG